MATQTVCDACGKISPDPNGLYIANDWSRIVIAQGVSGLPREITLCTDCLPRHSVLRELAHDVREVLRTIQSRFPGGR